MFRFFRHILYPCDRSVPLLYQNQNHEKFCCFTPAGDGFSAVSAQVPTQRIRGQVTDKQTTATLPGVNILVENSDPLIGSASDPDGYFVLENVPVGRVSLTLTYVGYEPVFLNNLELTSGKELLLNVEMTEQVVTVEEVVIKASRDKTEL